MPTPRDTYCAIFCLKGKAHLLLGKTLLDIQGPAGCHRIKAGGQSGLRCRIDCRQKQSCDTYRKLISNIGRENLVLLGCRRKRVLAVEYIQSCTDEVKYGCDEDGQSAVGQHHLVQFLHICGGGETLHNILAGYIGGTGVKTCAHNQQGIRCPSVYWD